MAWDTGSFQWLLAAGCLLTALFLQIASNLANDYFDHFSRVDTAERLGPLRVTQAGLLPPGQVKWAFIGCLLGGTMAGLGCAYRAGPGILIVGAICVACALLYSAGPLPLSHVGLGELPAFLFFGPVACGGTYYVLTREIPWVVLIAGAMPGLYAAAMLAINNLRDLATDARAGKRTLAVRFGEAFARYEAAALVLAPAAVVLALFFISGRATVLLALFLTLPAGHLAVRLIRTPISRQFNLYLARAAQLDLLASVSLAVLWCANS